MRQSQRARNVPNHLREYQLSEESLAAIEYSASQGNATLSQIQRNHNDWDMVMPDNEDDRIPDLDEDEENETDVEDDDERDESEAEESDEEEGEEQKTIINYSDACQREPDTCNNLSGATPFNFKEFELPFGVKTRNTATVDSGKVIESSICIDKLSALSELPVRECRVILEDIGHRKEVSIPDEAADDEKHVKSAENMSLGGSMLSNATAAIKYTTRDA